MRVCHRPHSWSTRTSSTRTTPHLGTARPPPPPHPTLRTQLTSLLDKLRTSAAATAQRAEALTAATAALPGFELGGGPNAKELATAAAEDNAMVSVAWGGVGLGRFTVPYPAYTSKGLEDSFQRCPCYPKRVLPPPHPTPLLCPNSPFMGLILFPHPPATLSFSPL